MGLHKTVVVGGLVEVAFHVYEDFDNCGCLGKCYIGPNEGEEIPIVLHTCAKASQVT